jgi:hypothetical protein
MMHAIQQSFKGFTKVTEEMPVIKELLRVWGIKGGSTCYGLLVCTPFTGGYVASAHPVAQMHWTPATWPSARYHDRTCTSRR